MTGEVARIPGMLLNLSCTSSGTTPSMLTCSCAFPATRSTVDPIPFTSASCAVFIELKVVTPTTTPRSVSTVFARLRRA